MSNDAQNQAATQGVPAEFGDRPDIRLEIVSNPVYLAGVRDLVSTVAKRAGFDEMECSQIALALDEALCNVIRHGYKGEVGRPIWVSLWPKARGDDNAAGLTVWIEDEADQVDPESIKSRDLDDIRPGGLGVHIIQEIMDEVRFEKRGERGMRLVITKESGLEQESAG